MKRLFLSICLTLMWGAIMAVPAKRVPFTVTQSNGTTLTLVLCGDEHMHFYENVATGEKMQRAENGDYYVMEATVFDAMKRSAAVRRSKANDRRRARLAPQKVGSFGEMKGNKKGLVILVNFADVKFNNNHTQSTFDNMFNQEGYSENGHIGSVADYFRDQSYGQFNLSFDVVGPVTLSQNMSYYGGNDSNGNDLRPGHMAKEACQLADDLGVDFSQYDWDGDGDVDQVFVIYAGFGENYYGSDPNTIWPHEWDLHSSGASPYKVDGVTVNTYACAAELYGTSGTALNGMGTACHEFSHCLGYPDSYDIDYSGGIGMDSFDVMCGGSYNGPNGRGEVPCGYTAFQRMCAGWLDPVELSEPTNVNGMDDLGSSATAYIIYNENNSNEFLMFENRQSDRWFRYYDYGEAGHGLFVTHIDYDATVWAQNKPNDDPSHQRLAWIPADGKYGTYDSKYKDWTVSNTDQKGDFFPGTSTVTSLKYTSHSNVGGRWFAGSTPYKDITDIAEANGKISFKYDGGDDGTRYTVTFDAGAGSCTTTSWTQTKAAEGVTLPECAINSEEWTFEGWCAKSVAETTTKPTLLTGQYVPKADVTLYAVYKKMEGEGSVGTYTLYYDVENNLKESKDWGSYGKAYTYTAQDGGKWVIKAYKNVGMQINNGKDASIKVPECPSPITNIHLAMKSAKRVSFSATDYNGSNNPTAVATSASAGSVDINLSGKGMTTGYLYTTDGSTVITMIVVTYGGDGSSAISYATNPDLTVLAEPVLTFAKTGDQTMLVGDVMENKATVEGSTAPIEYGSSDTSVATVDANGKVTAKGVGTTTITAKVAKVDGQSKAAQVSYTLTVSMPVLTDLKVKTMPTKTEYVEGETFSTDGMVLTAIYANGYECDITEGYVVENEVLAKGQTSVTIAYTQGEVTKNVAIEVKVEALPVYTVTFVAGKGECSVTSMAETSYGQGVVLPSCGDINDTWTFAGWSTQSVDFTTAKQELQSAGSSYKPKEDCTLYAVYKKTEGEGERWKKVAVSQVTSEGVYALLTTDGHAFNGTISSGHGQVTNGKFVFDNDGYATTAPEGTCELTLTAVTGGYSMYCEGKGYLYAKDAKSGNLAWNVKPVDEYWYADKGEWRYHSVGAYLRNYSNSSFRTYKDTTNGTVLILAQKVGAETITYSSNPLGEFSISSAGYATYFTDKAFVMPEGVEGAVAVMNGEKVKFDYVYEEGSVVPANTGLLLRATTTLSETTTFEYEVTKNDDKAPENLFRGSISDEQTTGGDKYYKLAMGSKGVGFYWGADNGGAFVNGAHKAYLALTSQQANGAKAIILGEEGVPTAIDDVTSFEENAPTYNLAGQRVNSSAKGILIRNGRKYVRK